MSKRYFLFSILIFFFLTSSCKKDFIVYKAQKGILDLRNWDSEKESVISLDGDWEFYWNQLIINTDKLSGTKEFLDLPATWNGRFIDGKKMDGSGFATFHLKLILPTEKQFHALAIRIKPFTNCRSFINDIEIDCMGKVGKDSTSSIPDTRNSFSSFFASNDSVDIIIQVSNFHHKKGGFLYPVYFGTEFGLLEYVQRIRNRDTFILGFLFFAFLYHLGLFFIRRQEMLSFYYSIIVLLTFLRTASTGEKLITDFYPVSYEVYTAIEYISFFLIIPLVILLVKEMFTLKISKWIIILNAFIGVALCLITIFSKPVFYSQLISLYLPFFIFQISAVFMVIILSVYHKKENAFLILIGFAVLVACTINDILNTTEVIHTSYIVHYGLLAIVFLQSIFLLLRFVKSFKANQYLSSELIRINEDLEIRILDRTREIMDEKIIAVKSNELKDKFISLLSHDIRAPLGNAKMLIENSIDFEKESDSRMAKEYIQLAKQSIVNALDMTEKLLKFNISKSGNIELNIQTFSPSEIFDKIFNIFLSRLQEKKIQLFCLIPEEQTMESDSALFQEVLLNLISNAIKFCKAGDVISVRSEILFDQYIIYVKDTGAGIPKEIIPNLFSNSVKTSYRGTSGEAGTGLGLPLCFDIMNMLKGEIKVNETLEKGTEIICTFPLIFPKK